MWFLLLSGMKIVQRLGSVACDVGDKPLSDLKILKATPSETPDVIARNSRGASSAVHLITA
jgi:hypothetical protein